MRCNGRCIARPASYCHVTVQMRRKWNVGSVKNCLPFIVVDGLWRREDARTAVESYWSARGLVCSAPHHMNLEALMLTTAAFWLSRRRARFQFGFWDQSSWPTSNVTQWWPLLMCAVWRRGVNVREGEMTECRCISIAITISDEWRNTQNSWGSDTQ